MLSVPSMRSEPWAWSRAPEGSRSGPSSSLSGQKEKLALAPPTRRASASPPRTAPAVALTPLLKSLFGLLKSLLGLLKSRLGLLKSLLLEVLTAGELR